MLETGRQRGPDAYCVGALLLVAEHCAFEYGVCALIERATGEADRLRRLRPDYYRP